MRPLIIAEKTADVRRGGVSPPVIPFKRLPQTSPLSLKQTQILVGGDVLDAPFKTITANFTFAR